MRGATPFIFLAVAALQSAERPNIVVILADDLGYGDVQCYNPGRGKIPTPHIDRLAQQGMRFTDAHASSSACSPTRYSLLTGRYHWRTRLQRGIVNVWGAPLIAPDRMTIGTLAKKQGYHTACIGKWHLGWDWPITDEQKKFVQGLGGQAGGGGKVTTDTTDDMRAAWKAIFSQPISGGPTTRGFDEYFGTCVPNWPPYCFIENNRTVGIPSTLMPARNFERNLASFQGPALENWKLEDILPTLVDRACGVIEKQAVSGKPFLLYMPLTAPHTPISPSKEWKGKSPLGPYGDFVMQTDAAVGQVLAALDKAKVADNTLVIFTSDNGCSLVTNPKELEKKGHYPSGPLQGYKASAWEGGHREPFIVRWPGRVKPGSVCEQTICSVDILATLAEIFGATLPANAGEDSVSLMSLLNGHTQPIHDAVVPHSSNGVFTIRSGDWKVIFNTPQGKPTGTAPQLFNLAKDLGETENLAVKHPDIVKRLTDQLQTLIDNGRSTPGARQKNDVEVTIRK